MKTSAIGRLRRMLGANEPVHGLWITLESPPSPRWRSPSGRDGFRRKLARVTGG